MLFELSKLVLERNYEKCNNLVNIGEINFDSSIEIKFVDLLKDETLRELMVKKILTDKNITHNKRKSLIKKLIDSKVNLKFEYLDEKLFHYVTDDELSKILVENKANVDARDEYGLTFLHKCNDAEVAKFLIENKVDVNEIDWFRETPLHRCESIEVVKVLLKSKADVNFRNNNNFTPLHFCEKTEIVKLLVENKADVNARCYSHHYYGSTPLHCCKNSKVAEILIENKADVNITCDHGFTALHRCENIEVIKVLIKAKADINVKDSRGYTFLEYNKNAEILQVLFEEDILFKIIDNTKITPELFKEHTKFIMRCILNYDNEVQNVINLMV